MALEDRKAIVDTDEESYALMGAALATDVPPQVIHYAVRPEILRQVVSAGADPYVTDEEMLGLLREAYFELVENVLRIHNELLGEQGEGYDSDLVRVGLTRRGRKIGDVD